MSRLIDADALKHSIAGNVPLMPTVRIAIEHRIDDAPTIEAEPVVHCKDCKHWETDWIPTGITTDNQHYCGMWDAFPCGDVYCSYGERKGDDEQVDKRKGQTAGN